MRDVDWQTLTTVTNSDSNTKFKKYKDILFSHLSSFRESEFCCKRINGTDINT
jgi:hypothetical protein